MREWLRWKHVRTRHECVSGGGTLRERRHVSARGYRGRVCVPGGLRRATVSGIPGLVSQVGASGWGSNGYSSSINRHTIILRILVVNGVLLELLMMLIMMMMMLL